MAKKYGCQIPSKSVFLVSEEKTTEYKKAVKLYKQSGGTPIKWQTDLLKHIMAKNKDGLWTHSKFGYSVPRRNGKSESMIMRILYGLEEGEDILYTAHRTTTSHSFYERIDEALSAMGYIKASEARKEDKVPNDLLYDAYKANGLESITLRKNKGRISFRTRTSKGGLGEGKDLLIHDEAQELQDDQESSLKYIVSDSKNPQTIMCGTPPTAVSSGTVFTKYREKCLAGGAKNSGWAEWSVDKMTDPNDKEAWYKTNPSLNRVFTERAIEDEIGSDDTDFNIQRLGLWLQYNQKSVISENLWNSLKVSEKPKLKGELHIGVKFSKNGGNVALSVACKTEEGKIFIETLFCRPITQGVGWIGEFLSKVSYVECVSDGKAGEQLMLDMAKDEKLKHIVFPNVAEIINANAVFEQSLYQKSICHNGQQLLTQVVSNCKKRTIGNNGGFGYESLVDELDIAVMDSAIYAYWSCQKLKERKKQRVQY